MSDDANTLINGVPAHAVAASDRGLAFGDGVFETMRCVGNSIPLLRRHLTRLSAGCRILQLTPPSIECWQQDIAAVLKERTDHGSCVIKLLLTRGSGGFGYAPPSAPAPLRIVQRLACPPVDAEDGLVCDVLNTRLGSNRQLAGVKHLNRIEQVLAASELAERSLHEGLVCNQQGFLIEAVSSNVILRFGQKVVTPALDTAGVEGVMRAVLMEARKAAGESIAEEFLYADVAHEADELVLCNSVRGVRRVARLGDTMLDQRTLFDTLRGDADTAFRGDFDRA